MYIERIEILDTAFSLGVEEINTWKGNFRFYACRIENLYISMVHNLLNVYKYIFHLYRIQENTTK